jgi:hypothetical protein
MLVVRIDKRPVDIENRRHTSRSHGDPTSRRPGSQTAGRQALGRRRETSRGLLDAFAHADEPVAAA